MVNHTVELSVFMRARFSSLSFSRSSIFRFTNPFFRRLRIPFLLFSWHYVHLFFTSTTEDGAHNREQKWKRNKNGKKLPKNWNWKWQKIRQTNQENKKMHNERANTVNGWGQVTRAKLHPDCRHTRELSVVLGQWSQPTNTHRPSEESEIQLGVFVFSVLFVKWWMNV